MKHRIISMMLICAITPLALVAKQSSSTGPQEERLTPERALAAVRSQSSPGSSILIAREFPPTANIQDFAQRSLSEASSRHVCVYNEGLFLGLLEVGGFLILEVDSTTGNAISINLVSRGTTGRIAIESNKVEGTIRDIQAKELIKNTGDFVEALLRTPLSGLSLIEGKFDGGHFPEYSEFEDESFFATPQAIRALATDEPERRELAVLFGAFHFWPIRYALSEIIYPANPGAALLLGHKKHEAFVQEFVRDQKSLAPPECFPGDLESVRTPEQLRECITWFKRLDNFLEGALQKDRIPSIFSANLSISTVPLELGATGPDSFSLLTLPGLIINCRHRSQTGFAVRSISSAEESNPD